MQNFGLAVVQAINLSAWRREAIWREGRRYGHNQKKAFFAPILLAKRFCKQVAILAEACWERNWSANPHSFCGKVPWIRPLSKSRVFSSFRQDATFITWRCHKQLEPILDHGRAVLGKELSVSDLHTSFGHTCLNAFAHNTSCKHCHGTCPRACFCDVTLSFALHGNLNQNYEDILQFLTRLIWRIWLIWLVLKYPPETHQQCKINIRNH